MGEVVQFIKKSSALDRLSETVERNFQHIPAATRKAFAAAMVERVQRFQQLRAPVTMTLSYLANATPEEREQATKEITEAMQESLKDFCEEAMLEIFKLHLALLLKDWPAP